VILWPKQDKWPNLHVSGVSKWWHFNTYYFVKSLGNRLLPSVLYEIHPLPVLLFFHSPIFPSLVLSSVRSFIRSFIPLVHSLIHSFIRSFVRSFIHSLINTPSKNNGIATPHSFENDIFKITNLNCIIQFPLILHTVWSNPLKYVTVVIDVFPCLGTFSLSLFSSENISLFLRIEKSVQTMPSGSKRSLLTWTHPGWSLVGGIIRAYENCNRRKLSSINIKLGTYYIYFVFNLVHNNFCFGGFVTCHMCFNPDTSSHGK